MIKNETNSLRQDIRISLRTEIKQSPDVISHKNEFMQLVWERFRIRVLISHDFFEINSTFVNRDQVSMLYGYITHI